MRIIRNTQQVVCNFSDFSLKLRFLLAKQIIDNVVVLFLESTYLRRNTSGILVESIIRQVAAFNFSPCSHDLGLY